MTLHMVTIFDDDPTSTAADLAAADFIDGESIVQTRDGQVPILKGIQATSYGTSGTVSYVLNTPGQAFITLMPSTWKETNKIFHEIDKNVIPFQDTTTTDFHDAMFQPEYLDAWNGGYNIQLTENMNWINAGDSQWTMGNATAHNCNISLFYQYGSAIPWDGASHPCVRVAKQASADVTADTWSTVANELFTDDGLDPDAVYRPLWGYATCEAASDANVCGWRMTSTDNKTWIGGWGSGDAISNYARTTFHGDSILINGDSQVTFEALAEAACKPSVVVYFQEVRKGAEPTSVSPTRARSTVAARGPVAGRTLRMPTFGGFGRR